MRREQHDQLVARAIVSHEVACLRGGGGAVLRDGPLPSLTVPAIIEAYGIDWATYHTTDGRIYGRAEQLIRNCLNEEFLAGTLSKINRELHAGSPPAPLKDGRWIVYAEKCKVPYRKRITPRKEAT